MKKQIVWILVCLTLLLAACGGAGSPDYPMAEEAAEEISYEVSEELADVAEVQEEVEIAQEEMAEISESSGADEVANADDEGISLAEEQGIAPRRTRMIIKDGQIGVMVEDTQKALDSVGQLTATVGGYIIEQNAYTLDGFGYVTMQIGVPVTEFERAMVALRKLGTVTKDAASGTDVTDEFVDLGSRLENLEIKRDRLRAFMADAKKIDDILKIEAQLSEVEEEMAIIQGRINFLRDRSSFSTISIQLDPIIPTPTPSPTPTITPTPSPTPSPTPEMWRPSETAQIASSQLRGTLQNTADGVIYTGIICGPWVLLLLILGYGLLVVSRRFGFSLTDLTRRETIDQSRVSNLSEENDESSSEE